MNWLTAGMLQGGGQALANVGSELSKAGVTATLQDQRDTMENARAQKNLDAQKAMQTENLAANKANLLSGQKHQENLQEQNHAHVEALAKDSSDATLKAAALRYTQDQTLLQDRITADKQNAQTKMGGDLVVAGISAASNERIHKATNLTTLEAARIHEAVAIKTANSSDIKELNHSLDTLELAITSLQKESNELVADPKSPAYRAIQDRLSLLQRSAADSRAILNARQGQQAVASGLTVAPPSTASTAPTGTKTMTAEQYANNVAKKGQAATDAFVKANNIAVAPPAAPQPGGMLDAQVNSFKQNADPDNQYAQPPVPPGTPVPGYDMSALRR